jgi:tetratricopeptide (TPR) repeat protein
MAPFDDVKKLEDQISSDAREAFRNHDYVRALPDIEAASIQFPRNWFAHFLTGHCLKELGRYEEAIPILKKAEEIEPRFYYIQQDLGDCEFKLEDYRSAMYTHMRMSTNLPHKSYPLIMCAMCLFKSDMCNDAIDILNTVEEKFEGDERVMIQYVKGLIHEKQGSSSDAVMEFIKCRMETDDKEFQDQISEHIYFVSQAEEDTDDSDEFEEDSDDEEE